MKKTSNGVIPSVKNQVLVLDRLAEFYFSWVDDFVELMSEMTWEISFRELRSTILYLYEFWYIKRSYTWKWNEFYVKITKKWITYYEKVFNPKKKLYIKESFFDKIKKIWEWVDAIKWIATWAVAIFTIFWVVFHWEIKEQFSAKIIWNKTIEVQFTENEAIEFLKKEFSKKIQFNCKIKKIDEIVCEVKRRETGLENLHWTFEIKKIIPKKRIVLRKDNKWKIFLVK